MTGICEYEGNVENMHEPKDIVLYISQCNTWLRLLRLLYDMGVMWRKTIKHAFLCFMLS